MAASEVANSRMRNLNELGRLTADYERSGAFDNGTPTSIEFASRGRCRNRVSLTRSAE